jgi:glycosyltransferase involved in cell wall biosynthesis
MDHTISFATNHGDIAGGEVMMFAMARIARDLGCDVTVVAPTRPSDVLDKARTEGFRSIEIRATGRASYASGLRAWDARERTGLLWCNGLLPSFATAGHRNRVVHLHQEPIGKSQAAYLRIGRIGARRVVVPSLTMSAKIPGSVAVPNWNPEVILPDGPHKRSPRGAVLGFMGRHSTDKGLADLAHALAKLDKVHRGRHRLLLAGDSRFVADKDHAVCMAALSPVEDLVDHAGWLGREDFFESVDLAVFPSVFPESFGLVVSEAMSAGVPFVISDAGALPEVAGPTYRWVAKAGDADDLAATIERALHEIDKADLEASFERWRQEYSPEAGRRRLAAQLIGLGVLPPGTGS